MIKVITSESIPKDRFLILSKPIRITEYSFTNDKSTITGKLVTPNKIEFTVSMPFRFKLEL